MFDKVLITPTEGVTAVINETLRTYSSILPFKMIQSMPWRLHNVIVKYNQRLLRDICEKFLQPNR